MPVAAGSCEKPKMYTIELQLLQKLRFTEDHLSDGLTLRFVFFLADCACAGAVSFHPISVVQVALAISSPRIALSVVAERVHTGIWVENTGHCDVIIMEIQSLAPGTSHSLQVRRQ